MIHTLGDRRGDDNNPDEELGVNDTVAAYGELGMMTTATFKVEVASPLQWCTTSS